MSAVGRAEVSMPYCESKPRDRTRNGNAFVYETAILSRETKLLIYIYALSDYLTSMSTSPDLVEDSHEREGSRPPRSAKFPSRTLICGIFENIDTKALVLATMQSWHRFSQRPGGRPVSILEKATKIFENTLYVLSDFLLRRMADPRKATRVAAIDTYKNQFLFTTWRLSYRQLRPSSSGSSEDSEECNGGGLHGK